MFDSVLLDVFIGMALIYVLLSLVAASLIEMIAGLAKFRNSLLEGAMHQILGEEKYVNLFYHHPMINCFSKKPPVLSLIYRIYNWKAAKILGVSWLIKKLNLVKLYHIVAAGRPSYLSSKLFSQVMYDLISGGFDGMMQRYKPVMAKNAPGASDDCMVLDFNTFETYERREIGVWLEWFGYFNEMVTVVKKTTPDGATIGSVFSDQDQVQQRIADWFDSQMERVTGYYKRKTQTVLLMVSLVFCMILNADSIMMVNVLWSDPVMREAAVYEATGIVKKGAAGEQSGQEVTADDLNAADMASPCTGCPGELTALEKAAISSSERPFPMGWQRQSSGVYKEFRSYPQTFKGWCYKVFGILITTLLISLGSPFWFDLLSKVVNIRNVGLKPKSAAESARNKG